MWKEKKNTTALGRACLVGGRIVPPPFVAASRESACMQRKGFHRDFSSMTKSRNPSFHFLACSAVGLGSGLLP